MTTSVQILTQLDEWEVRAQALTEKLDAILAEIELEDQEP
jgi:hypothetical protein